MKYLYAVHVYFDTESRIFLSTKSQRKYRDRIAECIARAFASSFQNEKKNEDKP